MTMMEMREILKYYENESNKITFEEVNHNTFFVNVDYQDIDEDSDDYEVINNLIDDCEKLSYRQEENSDKFEPCYTYYFYEFCKGVSVPIGDIVVKIFLDIYGEDL